MADVSPNHGSLLGGTCVAIAGEGFGNDTSLVKVTIGNAPCEVKTVTDTEITCVTQRSCGGRTVDIDNYGPHACK